MNATPIPTSPGPLPPLTALCNRIEATHHVYLRRELPTLTRLTTVVRDVHGGRQPSLHEVAEVFAGLRAELEAHMEKEEKILFPMIRALEQGGGPREFHCGSIGNPIRVMVYEHDQAGAALERLRALTGGYAPPADACPTYRAMLQGLAGLELDLSAHIRTENEDLFPAAVELEAANG